MHVFPKRSFLCRHITGIGSIFLTGFLPGICSKFLAGFLPKFLVHIPGRIPAWNLVQIPGRIPANLNISRQIPQGVHTDSCRNLYKKNQIVKGIPARNLVSFSCGNTAVFLLDNFVRVGRERANKQIFIFGLRNSYCPSVDNLICVYLDTTMGNKTFQISAVNSTAFAGNATALLQRCL